jgi:8-oxo-dGTP pyrophosphatase MutT (NUDIX family)/phosphohistidine phosphatase SixA
VNKTIRAAGTVVFRGKGKATEVLVVHRSHRNDWSLPKGKREKGEYMVATAARETLEETGIEVILGVPLKPIKYESLGFPKIVRYWVAKPVDPEIATGLRDLPADWQPNDEVDEVRWIRASKVSALLTYEQDIDVVNEALGLSRNTVPFILLRHSDAEKRVDFAEHHKGNPPSDQLRPLSAEGLSYTAAIADALNAYGVEYAYSSISKRCVDTLAPAFATKSSLNLESVFSEEGANENPSAAKKRIKEIIEIPKASVLCSHRPVMPLLIRTISKISRSKEPMSKLKPGHFVVYHRPIKDSGKLRENQKFVVEHSADSQSKSID